MGAYKRGTNRADGEYHENDYHFYQDRNSEPEGGNRFHQKA